MTFPGFAVLFVAAYVSFYKLLNSKITKIYIKNTLLSSDERDRELLPKLLKAFMPSKSVFSGISLPIPGREGEEIAYGTVAINRAGIFLLCRICGDGLLENSPTSDKWKLMNCGSVKEFPNPFKDQDAPRRLLAYYASAAGVENVRVHTLVVYTNSGLRFSNPPNKGMISVASLYKRMCGMSRKGRLSQKNVTSISRMIREVNEGNIELAI